MNVGRLFVTQRMRQTCCVMMQRASFEHFTAELWEQISVIGFTDDLG